MLPVIKIRLKLLGGSFITAVSGEASADDAACALLFAGAADVDDTDIDVVEVVSEGVSLGVV